MRIYKADVLDTGRPRYMTWQDVPAGYRTTTKWSEAGMKPIPDAEPIAYVYCRGRSTHFGLYTPEQVVARKRRRDPRALDPTPENLGKALFEVNKAAKRRRDAAKRSYSERRFRRASNDKACKEELYALKDDVLDRAAREGLATFAGYHVKRYSRDEAVRLDDDEIDATYGDGREDDVEDDYAPWERGGGGRDCERRTIERVTYMACSEIGGFRFHRIVDELPEATKQRIHDLGTWESAAAPVGIHMPLMDAVATLEAYLESRAESVGDRSSYSASAQTCR